jgi:hypothetical protein
MWGDRLGFVISAGHSSRAASTGVLPSGRLLKRFEKEAKKHEDMKRENRAALLLEARQPVQCPTVAGIRRSSRF